MSTPCPDCRDGKHRNCAGWAIDKHDRETPCPCECQELATT